MMCVVPSLPLVLSLFTKTFLDMYKPPQNLPSCFRCVVFFRFKLFEERVVQGSQVFVNEEVMVHLRTVDAQLFFFARNKKTLSL